MRRTWHRQTLALVAGLVLLAGCSNADDTEPDPADDGGQTEQPGDAPPDDAPADGDTGDGDGGEPDGTDAAPGDDAQQWDSPPEMTIDPEGTYTAAITTNHGTITVDLFADQSPVTVNNFVFLAREGFYDGLIFHRVISGFMLQGGDPTGTGMGGPGYQFDDELEAAEELGYDLGVLAMANSGPNTNGSQFFIMHADYPLPPQYNVFGQATGGLEVIDEIGNTPTEPGDRPVDDVIIESIEITEG